MIEIKLTQGKVALIDDADWPLVCRFRWFADKGHSTFYAVTKVLREGGGMRNVSMHRMLLGLTDPRIHTDHRDGNGLNNTRSNLRTCTHAENRRNTGVNSNNKSGFKGVSWDKSSGKWRATIMANRKQKSLGCFTTPEAAYEAYCRAAVELHGAFANFGAHQAKNMDKPNDFSLCEARY